MRVATDGFIDIRDERRVRTPGFHEDSVDPMPEGEALSFLLSHSSPGHRRIVRSMTASERRQVRLAAWADSVSERMALVDRVWRAITEPMVPVAGLDGPQLVQVVQYGHWAWPMYLSGGTTFALPHGGVPIGELEGGRTSKVLRLDHEPRAAGRPEPGNRKRPSARRGGGAKRSSGRPGHGPGGGRGRSPERRRPH